MRSLPSTAFVLLCAACTSSAPDRREDPVTQSPPAAFDATTARAKVDALVAASTFLKEAWVGPVPELDVAGMFAFSAMPPSTGKAGEVLFWVGPDEILSTGAAARDFDRLMARLGVGARAGTIEAPRLALLFTRFRAMRRGVVLERPDGHPLLKAGAIAAAEFHPPELRHDPAGAHLRFWLFDTDRLEPSHWTVEIAGDGATRFTSP